MRRPTPKTILIGLAGLVVVGSLVAALTLGASSSPQVIAIHPTTGSGAALPDARGVDPVTGAPVSFASFRGKPVFANMWASWCPGCNEEACDIARFVKDHPGIGFVGIDVQDTPSDAKAFYAKWERSRASAVGIGG